VNDNVRTADCVTWCAILLLMMVIAFVSRRPTDEVVVLQSKLRFAEQECRMWEKRYFDLKAETEKK